LEKLKALHGQAWLSDDDVYVIYAVLGADSVNEKQRKSTAGAVHQAS
jgi:hypothetical protein